MEKQFVTYEIALKLKELGFDEECFGRFDICDTEELQEIYEIEYFLTTINNYFNSGCKYIKVPIWQQVIDFLREEYLLHIEIQSPDYTNDVNFAWAIHKMYLFGTWGDGYESNYYKAREQAILKAIELCQNKKF